MKIRVFATLVCLIMVLALLPATARAGTPLKSYADREAAAADSDTWEDDKGITIGGQTYVYRGDVSDSGISMGNETDQKVTGKTVYKAGRGIVLWDPTIDSSTNKLSGTLTLHNATIVTGDSIEKTIELPGAYVKLVLEGKNEIENKAISTSGGKIASCVENSESSEFTGSGSLNMKAEHGTGIQLSKGGNVIITGGNITIEAKKGVDWSYHSDDTGNSEYKQSGGSVKITGSNMDSAINVKKFELSGGSLEIKGKAKGAIFSEFGATVSGGSLTINGNFKDFGIFSAEQVSDEGGNNTDKNTGINFTGGVTDITLNEGEAAIQFAYSKTFDADIAKPTEQLPQRLTIGPNMRVVKGGSVVWSDWKKQSDEPAAGGHMWNAFCTMSEGEVSIGEDAVNGASNRVRIEPQPGTGGYSYTPSPVTVYNATVPLNATIWLTGAGLSSGDLLITERSPYGSAYKALIKLADSNDVFNTYNIYLHSGIKSTGYAMYLHFNLDAKHAGNEFTLVHQKADGTYEYLYGTADANGDLSFGPLYELSPFMLVKGRLVKTAYVNLDDVPKTGDSAQPMLCVALLAAALLAGTALYKRRSN